LKLRYFHNNPAAHQRSKRQQPRMLYHTCVSLATQTHGLNAQNPLLFHFIRAPVRNYTHLTPN